MVDVGSGDNDGLTCATDTMTLLPVVARPRQQHRGGAREAPVSRCECGVGPLRSRNRRTVVASARALSRDASMHAREGTPLAEATQIKTTKRQHDEEPQAHVLFMNGIFSFPSLHSFTGTVGVNISGPGKLLQHDLFF